MACGFKYLLVLPDGEPHDTCRLRHAIPNWEVGEVLTLGDGQRLRIAHINLDLDDARLEELCEQGSTGSGSSSRPISARRSTAPRVGRFRAGPRESLWVSRAVKGGLEPGRRPPYPEQAAMTDDAGAAYSPARAPDPK
jgi:hypothetical protein